VPKLLKKGLIIATWTSLFALLCYGPNFSPTSSKAKNLSILTWGDILDTDVIADFEKQTGIKVSLSYYGSNEELLVKMKATGGEGYDILIPSDYAVAKLIENDLVRPIQKEKITNFSKIDPLLLNKFYDPKNTYSLPFEWEVYGFGYNKNVFPTMNSSWDLLFDKDLDFKYVMTNDPNEAIQFASFYLFKERSKLNLSELNIVIDLLSQARKRTEAYASFRADYFLATKSVPLVITSSSYIWRSVKNYPFIGFTIPQEGSFITIENVCISKASKNIDNVHALIDYLYSDQSAIKHFETFGFFPSTISQVKDAPLDTESLSIIKQREELFKKLHFINELSTQEKIQDAWVKIKVSSLP
jgi:spermidine/putrescine transport system substrate-binding protein